MYRGAGLARLASVRLVLCGAGALGSHLADNLVRQGVTKLRVIDRDRIETHNVGTQLYGECDVGGWKTEVLRNRLFRTAGVEAEVVTKELTHRNAAALLKGADLVIDTFDNSAARQLVQDQCRAQQVPCLHLGLFADYGEVIWDSGYRVPTDGTGDVCDYPLARNLVLLVVAVGSEAIVRFVLEGQEQSWSVTLHDFAVQSLEAPIRS